MRLLPLLLLISVFTSAAEKDSVTSYHLPDSLRGASFVADVNVHAVNRKEVYAGLATGDVRLMMEKNRKEAGISFEFPAAASVAASGLHTKTKKDRICWDFNWQLNTDYKLMIAAAADTAENFTLYSGYLFLPGAQQWKLIGTCRISGQCSMIRDPKAVQSNARNASLQVVFGNVLIQDEKGPWKRIHGDTRPLSSPVIPRYASADSAEQFSIDKQIIEQAINAGATDVKDNIENVYYRILDPGKGRSFTVNDSITARYQLRIFGTSDVISGSTTETYHFALRGLIRAWQLAVPLVKTGGRIKLVIPSGLAYSIRTRGAQLPPNSILEFEVEVLDAQAKQP